MSDKASLEHDEIDLVRTIFFIICKVFLIKIKIK